MYGTLTKFRINDDIGLKYYPICRIYQVSQDKYGTLTKFRINDDIGLKYNPICRIYQVSQDKTLFGIGPKSCP